MRQPLPIALFLTDETRIGDPVTAIQTLPSGVGVIVREYGRSDRSEHAAKLVDVCRRTERLVLIAGDMDLAEMLQADGVHWPAALLPWRRVGRRGPGIVTAAVHDRRELHAAGRAGVDAVIVSPVFPTPSHPNRSALGINAFARLALASPVPVYAMGGVSFDDGGRLAMAGASGIAGIGMFL